MKTAILIYEIQQIRTLVDFLASVSEEEKTELTVIALGADIEFLLEKEGVSFQSGRDLRSTSHLDCHINAEKIGREVLSDPAFSFFSYREVPLVNVCMPVLQTYLMSILYFVDVLTTLAENHPHFTRLILFPHTYIPLETDGIMAPLEASAAVDAARIVAKKHDLEIFIPEFETSFMLLRVRKNIALYYMKRRVFGWALFVLNTIVKIGVPRKSIRILASDNWKNISSLVRELPDAELLLLDRAEARKIDWSSIWRNRMRFMHVQSFVSNMERKASRSKAHDFALHMEKIRNENVPLQEAGFRGHSLTAVISVAIQNLLERGGGRAVSLIDGSYSLCEQMRPDIVLVRASLSTQIHFPILCHVARALGIPSLEVQHGLLYLGPGTFIRRPAVHYMATYGPLTSEGFKAFGYTDKTLFNIGSPRFDAYQAIHDKKPDSGHNERGFTIAAIVPEILPQSWSDSYEIVRYLSELASAVADMPNVLVILKLRPDPHNDAFYRSAIAQTFESVPHKIAQYEPLVDVFAESDAIVAIYSTTVLEALISGRPTVYNGSLEFHEALGRDLAAYADAGALLMANTQEDLTKSLESLVRDPQVRDTLVRNADHFMAENYSFDGKASQKLAAAVRLLAHREDETSLAEPVL
ncbi:MAG: hypothetical protein ACHQU0_01150 [Candidatus Paceibacteria bacterium]